MASMLFGVADCAQDETLHGLVEKCPARRCLYQGDLDPEVAAASPWLVPIENSSPLQQAWQSRGWRNNWGILLHSPLSLGDLYQVLAQRTEVMLPSGEVALLRFYDPRVWRNLMSSCSPHELGEWFHGIEAVIAPTPCGTSALWYRYTQGGLEVSISRF